MRVLALLAAAVVTQAAAGNDAFEAGLAAAQKNEASESGRAYEKPFLDSIGEPLGRVMRECFPMTQDDVGTKFTLVLAIQADGTIGAQHARPNTVAVACVAQRIKDTRVATPPRPDWWVFLDLSITP